MRYGPGQSGPPPSGKIPHPTPTYKKGKVAAGGAVLRRQTFQPENKKQQAQLKRAIVVAARQRAAKSPYAKAEAKFEKKYPGVKKGVVSGLKDVERVVTAPGRYTSKVVLGFENTPAGGFTVGSIDPLYQYERLKGSRKEAHQYVNHPSLKRALNAVTNAAPLAVLPGGGKGGGKKAVSKAVEEVFSPGFEGKRGIPEAAAGPRITDLYDTHTGRFLKKGTNVYPLTKAEMAMGGVKNDIREFAKQHGYGAMRTPEGKYVVLDQASLLPEGKAPYKPLRQGREMAGESPYHPQQTLFDREDFRVAPPKTKAQKVVNQILNVWNAPRSLMSSADVSFGMRQGIVSLAMDPKAWLKDWKTSAKVLGSEEGYQEALRQIHLHPDYEAAVRDGVRFTELGPALKTREEYFQSQAAERIPGAGRVVRGSGRAFTLMADLQRMNQYARMAKIAKENGYKLTEKNRGYQKTLGESIASVVNNATGRGELPGKFLEDSAPFINAIFFAPRLVAARVNMIANPYWYSTLHPVARREALKGMMRLAGGASVFLAAAHRAGAQVSVDPRSADFGKMKFGNTRFDLLGGFQQYLRIAAQLSTQTIVSSTTGEHIKLGHRYGQTSSLDVLKKFAEGKAAPPVSFIIDAVRGTDFEHKPFSVQKAFVTRLTPFIAQDMYDIFSEGSKSHKKIAGLNVATGLNRKNILKTLVGGAVSATGVGVQTYKAKTPASSGYGGRGGGGSAPGYLGGGSGSSGNYLPSGGSNTPGYLP